MAKWKQNGWRRRERNRWVEIKNEDLWRQLDELLDSATAFASRTSAATRAMLKTSAATTWLSRPTRNSCRPK